MSTAKDPFSNFKDRAKRTSKKPINSSKGVRVNRSFGDKMKARKDDRARKRAEYLSTLPKDPVKRLLYRLNPKRLYKYWFSREGALMLLKIISIGIAVLIVTVLAVFAYYRRDLPPNITDLRTCSNGASTTYYDRSGQTLLWASSGDVECYPVKIDQISPYLRNAVISSEDKDFYKHGGFSAQGFLRAALNNVRGGSTQGGSTITQQFVKNSLLTQEQRISRKIKELILSIEIERSYSKDEILNAYLNEIPFGSVYDGAEAASRGYFNKPAKDITLDEAALMTAIIPAPSYYSPYGKNTEKLVSRQHYVLDLMVQQGYVKKDEAEAAKKVDTLAKLSTSHNKYKNIVAPYFVLEVQEELEAKYGASNIQKQGYKVITTLNLDLQKIAEQTVTDTMPKVLRNNADNMAVVAADAQTGQILALVGGRGFDYPGYGQKNMATTPRSPGSTMKPYDYSSLMTQNKSWGAGSTFYDLKTNFGGGYQPDDYDLKQPGAMSMRQSLGGSRNIPAIKATYIAGVQNTIDLAKKMGVVSGTSCEPNCGLSAAIGDGSEIRLDEHVNGYATFARGGKYKPKTYILKVSDSRNKTIYEWKDTAGEQVLDPQIAYIVADMMSDTKVSYMGTKYRLNNGWKSALKTGTTNNKDNGWFMGYTNKLVFGMWMGRQNDNKSQTTFTDTILGPAWNSFMTQANQKLGYAKGSGWDKPSGIKVVCINQSTGYATTSGGNCDMFPNWYNPRYPDSSKKAEIDSVSKKLATECTPDLARQTITGGGIMSELPTSDPMYKNWIGPIQARYGAAGGAIPTDKDDVHTCDSADKPSITLSVVENGDGSYKLSATVAQGKNPLTTVNFKANGSIIDSGSIDVTSDTTVTINYTPSGTEPIQITAQVIDSVLYDVTTEPKTITPST